MFCLLTTRKLVHSLYQTIIDQRWSQLCTGLYREHTVQSLSLLRVTALELYTEHPGESTRLWQYSDSCMFYFRSHFAGENVTGILNVPKVEKKSNSPISIIEMARTATNETMKEEQISFLQVTGLKNRKKKLKCLKNTKGDEIFLYVFSMFSCLPCSAWDIV